ncbi:MAG: hypothetical protein IPK03_15845 [Bacteroidetes bacterium]|nr:hypothetical protein [Bacteroidota bacterium]
MKKILLFSALIITAAYVLTSCSKTSSGTAFTHATMKPWFDANCASCHASGKSDAGQWLYDPSNHESSIIGHKDHLKEVVHDKKTMPPTGASVADINAFKTWYDAGCPAN